MSFLSNIEWRRAEKTFAPYDSSIDEDVAKVQNAMIQAPSSFGIQPYHIIAVKNDQMKDRLRPASYHQPQVTECHTLFVICAKKNVPSRVDEYLVKASVPESSHAFYRNSLNDKTVEWSSRQAYIALGFGLAACAELKLASCPMEGFDTYGVKQVLNLPEDLVPFAYLAVGKKSETPHPYPRFRFNENEMITRYE
jgi:nitroreductase/dihydropteridine reductase